MIHSMTGFGDAQFQQEGVRYTLELRSLNNRYFKATIKLPEHCQYFESEVEKLLRTRLERGSIYLTLRLRDTRADSAYEINTNALGTYLHQIASVDQGSVKATIDLAALLALPGVCQPPEVDESRRQQEWTIIEQLAREAMDKVLSMRTEEGKALREDMVTQCDAIRGHVEQIRTKAPHVIAAYHHRLRTRVDTLISKAELQLNQDDLIKEVAIFAERCDISEELARLASHLDQFVNTCDERASAGRRLEFLAQEMLREANTIASKANDAEIAREVVEIKGLIDRLKEQAQNVE